MKPLEPIMPRRVVVTGIGVVTPLGSTLETFWESLVNGRSGIGHVSRIDPTNFASRIAGEVRDFNPEDYLERKEIRHMDLFCQYALGAGIQAIEDSGIDLERCDRDRAGVIVGSGIGGMYVFEEQVRTLDQQGPRRMSPFFIVMMISDIVAGHLSIRFGLQGPNFATTSACATSAHAIGCGVKSIRYGETDLIVAGGSEAPICPTGVGGFCAMKALSTRNEEPEKASRPFDLKRDGFVIAEGAGILVLEDLEHALAREAHIYGEIVGTGFTADAYHITAPSEDGRGAAQAMKAALRDGGLQPEEIDYINAHGTSTPLNDKSETIAIKNLFGEHAHRMLISSTKSMHGHMLGAAGAVELAATLLAIERGIIPPTINYEYPDPDCDLNYTPNRAVEKKIDTALSNAFGFGGHNACLAVRRYAP